MNHTATVSGARALAARSARRASRGGLRDARGAARHALALAQDRGVPVRPIRGTAGSLRLHPLHTPRALAEMAIAAGQVRRAAAMLGADIVHANSIRAGIVLRARAAARRHRGPRSRLPASGRGDARDDEADRRDGDARSWPTPSTPRAGRGRPRRRSTPRSSTTPSTSPASTRRGSTGRRRAPRSAPASPRCCSAWSPSSAPGRVRTPRSRRSRDCWRRASTRTSR